MELIEELLFELGITDDALLATLFPVLVVAAAAARSAVVVYVAPVGKHLFASTL